MAQSRKLRAPLSNGSTSEGYLKAGQGFSCESQLSATTTTTTNWETSAPKPEAAEDISHSNDHRLITNFTARLHDTIPQGFISVAHTIGTAKLGTKYKDGRAALCFGTEPVDWHKTDTRPLISLLPYVC